MGDKLFQHIPRRVVKFRENRPRDGENLVDGQKIKTRMLAIKVSVPNLTVARLEQFPSPQMTDSKPLKIPKTITITIIGWRHLVNTFIYR